MFAVLIHIYYPDSWEMIFREQLCALRDYSPILLVNLCNTNTNNEEVAAAIRQDFPAAVVIITPNKGKDIGGKLALIDLFLKMQLQSDYIILLHDKVSPHALRGDVWRSTLFRIIQRENIDKILGLFQREPKTGLIGVKEFIKTEYDEKTGEFTTSNAPQLKELLKEFDLHPRYYSFIGGTMYWVRTSIMVDFFSRHAPLYYRGALEPGNIMDNEKGSYAHAWERVLCWIAAQDYNLKGI